MPGFLFVFPNRCANIYSAKGCLTESSDTTMQNAKGSLPFAGPGSPGPEALRVVVLSTWPCL